VTRRQRINPHDRGSPEHVLFHRWKLTCTRAQELEREATITRTAADAERVKAYHYAKALAALGHPVTLPLQIEGPKS
jgi:hypothetical protein